MALAPILAHEDCAGLESSHQFGAGFVPAGIGIKQFGRCAIKTAEGFFLEPIGDHPRNQVFGQGGGRHGPKGHPPAGAKRVEAEGPDKANLGLDRCRIDRRHGQAAQRLASWVPGFARLPVIARAMVERLP